jgi:hypothetical protein
MGVKYLKEVRYAANHENVYVETGFRGCNTSFVVTRRRYGD